jgi:glyoxylase-like metal-dependent hydrolase (beta-lactamase superfamily II)
LITFGKDVGKRYTVPVPYYLIDHPKGKILFDTGNAREVATDTHDPHKHWGAIADVYVPDMPQEEYVVESLKKKVNVDPSEIKYVIMSHLHLDHAGGVGEFPNATYIVQQDELRWAYTPQFYQKLAYIRPDFDKPVKWFLLHGYEDDNFDIFNDGSLVIWFTPGHTPGHQNLVLKLKQGTMVLTGDSCYNMEILNENLLPGLGWNSELTVRSIQKLRWARDFLGYSIITGHDPDTFKTLKKAPEYYE